MSAFLDDNTTTTMSETLSASLGALTINETANAVDVEAGEEESKCDTLRSSDCVATSTIDHVYVMIMVHFRGMQFLLGHVTYSATRYDFFNRSFSFNNEEKLSGTKLLQAVCGRIRLTSGLLLDLDPVHLESAAYADTDTLRNYVVHCTFEDPEDFAGLLDAFDSNIATFDDQNPGDATLQTRFPALTVSPVFYNPMFKNKRIVVQSFLRRGRRGSTLSRYAEAGLLSPDAAATVVLRKKKVTEGPYAGTVTFTGSPLEGGLPNVTYSPELLRFCKRAPLVSPRFFRAYRWDYNTLAAKQVERRLQRFPEDRQRIAAVSKKFGYRQFGCAPRGKSRCVWQWPTPAPLADRRPRQHSERRNIRQSSHSGRVQKQSNFARGPVERSADTCWRRSRKELFAAAL